MAALAMVGSVAAIGALVAAGVVAPSHFLSWFQSSTRISLAVTLTIGIFITGYEMMRARVAQASAEAQLASLESRVQPHFLFNTLNSIAALVHDDPAGAEQMTTRLASLMRSALDERGEPLVPLVDELRVVRDYLEIERVRFGDRLRFSIVDEAAASDAMVPRLAVQTLVENAVKHAVTPARGGATIVVRASAANGRLRVSVEDDGPGFDPKVLPEGHGLALLRARLGLLFTDRPALDIDSAAGRTVVRMDLGLTTAGNGRQRRAPQVESSRLA
jgi:LytS/YehU family sensor histidine kinase